MTIHIESSVDIARAAAAVWEVVGDFAHDRRWRQGIYRSERTSPGPMAVGATLLEGAWFLGRDIVTHSDVTAYEPGRCWSFATTAGPIKAWGTHALKPTAGGSRFTYTLHAAFPGPLRLVEPLLTPIIAWRIKGDLRRLKLLMEIPPMS